MAETKRNKPAWNFKDLTSQKFGKLLVLRLSHITKRSPYWLCRCECGTEKPVAARHIVAGKTISCGCHRREATLKRSVTHGLSNTKEYLAWSDAKTRCFNTGYRTYPLYGGRGITMCEEWRDSFEAFLSDMGPCPTDMTLERIDVNGDYSKDNCRWATHQEQARNTRRNIVVTYQGETLPLWEWSERSGVPMKILNGRHQRGTNILGPRTRRWQKRPA